MTGRNYHSDWGATFRLGTGTLGWTRDTGPAFLNNIYADWRWLDAAVTMNYEAPSGGARMPGGGWCWMVCALCLSLTAGLINRGSILHHT